MRTTRKRCLKQVVIGLHLGNRLVDFACSLIHSPAQGSRAVDRASHRPLSVMDRRPVTLAILGCGRLGTAILRGLIAALEKNVVESSVGKDARTGAEDGFLLPRRFVACVRTTESVAALESQFQGYLGPSAANLKRRVASVEVWRGRNVEATDQATIVVLACQPSQLPAIVAEDGMTAALRGKLALSICAGIPESAIRQHIGCTPQNGDAKENSHGTSPDDYYIVHAMPNAASMVGQSATIITQPSTSSHGSHCDPLRENYEPYVAWILGSIGTLTVVSPKLMNAASITAGCTPGFLGPVMMGITAGAVAAGLEEDVALHMVAQAMKGTAEMVLRMGERPKGLMDKVATPGGCTERGLRVLLDTESTGSVPAAFEAAIRDAVTRAFELGAG